MPLTAETTIDRRTLQQFLAVTREELSARMDSETLIASARDNKKKFATWMSSSHWPHLSGEVAEHVCGFLQDNVVGIFAGTWSRFAELRKCARETLESPGGTMNLHLADHKFSYAMEPSIDVRLNGAHVATIPFTIELAFAASGLELHLRRGSIDAVRSGKCNCDAHILLAGHSVWAHLLESIFPANFASLNPSPSSPRQLAAIAHRREFARESTVSRETPSDWKRGPFSRMCRPICERTDLWCANHPLAAATDRHFR